MAENLGHCADQADVKNEPPPGHTRPECLVLKNLKESLENNQTRHLHSRQGLKFYHSTWGLCVSSCAENQRPTITWESVLGGGGGVCTFRPPYRTRGRAFLTHVVACKHPVSTTDQPNQELSCCYCWYPSNLALPPGNWLFTCHRTQKENKVLGPPVFKSVI